MPRFLHTADWQLGLKLRRLTDERGARARDERFRTVERIAELAKAEKVDAVVVAGDVFDDNQVGPWVLSRARDALKAFGDVPVLLLPGNHDAAEPGGALARLKQGARGLDHVEVLLDDTPVELDGLTFFPCPLTQRHSAVDPTRHLPSRQDGETGVRVAIAHGGAHGFGGTGDAINRIDVDGVLSRGFDYLALGDWHGVYEVNARAWYPGAPEPTRFVEKEPGFVLLVHLPEAGATPSVRREAVAGTTWHEPEPFELHGPEDLDRLEAWLDGLHPRASTLVRLHLRGALALDERSRLDALLERTEGELLSLQIRSFDVTTAIDDDRIDALDAPGFLGDALRQLAHAEGEHEREAARLLYRLVQEARA